MRLQLLLLGARTFLLGTIILLQLTAAPRREQPGSAQQCQENSSPSEQNESVQTEQTPEVKIDRLIRIDTVVVGKDGRYIDDLRRENFKVEEDGIPQQIVSVDHYRAAFGRPDKNLEQELRVFDWHASIEREKLLPDLINRRVILLYFDMTSLTRKELERAVNGAIKFVKEKMSPADLIAVVSYGAGFVVNSNLTNNKQELESALASLIPLKDFMSGSKTVSPCPADAKYCQEVPAHQVGFDTSVPKNSDYALLTTTSLLGMLPGRKSVIQFVGTPPAKSDAHPSGQCLIRDLAAFPTVSFYEVDLRGRGTGDSDGMADKDVSGAEQLSSRQPSRRMLTTLAQQTGGGVFTDFTDFETIFLRVEQDSEDYYMVAYYTPNKELDGKFRKVVVEVGNAPGAHLRFRPGYYGMGPFTANARGDQTLLADAVR